MFGCFVKNAKAEKTPIKKMCCGLNEHTSLFDFNELTKKRSVSDTKNIPITEDHGKKCCKKYGDKIIKNRHEKNDMREDVNFFHTKYKTNAVSE